MFVFEATPGKRGYLFTFEQLEERIVLDGAVEAAALSWAPPNPGSGIFDGEFHRLEDRTFVFLEDQLHGIGVGYWWDPNNNCWGWAFDYETGWWWENRGEGWDWMNCAWYDFEQYANAGLCVFDGQHRIDEWGMEFWYDQAEDEMVYARGPELQFKYEFGSATDSGWGWDYWSDWTWSWQPFGDDFFGDEFTYNGYSGHTCQCMWTGFWHALPGGHGMDWTAVARDPWDHVDTVVEQYFWFEGRLDMVWNSSSGWSHVDGWTIPEHENVRYIGESALVFESSSYEGADFGATNGYEWIVYDGSWGVDEEWFRYACYDYDPNEAWGSAAFGPTLQLAFLNIEYAYNERYLESNVISIIDSFMSYKGGGWADLYDMAEMMRIVSSANASLYFDTVMVHDSDNLLGEGFWLGGSLIDLGSIDSFHSEFTEIGGMMLGDGEPTARFQILNSNGAENAGDVTLMETVYDYLNVDTPYGAEVELWANIDWTGTWDGVTGHEPNWNLEWDISFDPGSQYASYLDWEHMLFPADVLDADSTELDGDL